MTSPFPATSLAPAAPDHSDPTRANHVHTHGGQMRARLVHAWQKAHLFAAKGFDFHQSYARWRMRRLVSQWSRAPLFPSGPQLARAFTLDHPALAEVRAACAEGDAAQIHAALHSYFQARTWPRFCVMRADRQELVALVEEMDSAGRDQTIQTADQVCANTFSFRGAPPVHFAAEIDWQHAPDDNTDWRWDLNRHTYFVTLGRAYWYTNDTRYVERFSALLHSWLDDNPPHVSQPNWSSVFEVAFRINTWLWAFFLLQDALDDATAAALLAGLWAHGRYVDAHLEEHTHNNHALLEAKALAMLGLLMPEFEQSSHWRTRGLAIFTRELQAQVCADGVHGERASLYHRIISGELLELMVMAAQNDITIPQEIHTILGKMVEFEMWITKPDGQISLVGDSAQDDMHLRVNGSSGGAAFLQRGDLKALAPAPGEREIWLLGAERVRQYQALTPQETPQATQQATAQASRAFAEGGYFVLRAGKGAQRQYALFDCGPFGYARDATHGHADALSFELYAEGQSWIVDPGVYSTHLGWMWRRYFRGTAAHNTVVVDEQDQSLLLDARRVYRPARATLEKWVSNTHFDYVAGTHDGYTRLAAPVIHRRQFCFVKHGYWLVVDDLMGEGEHCFDLYFHLAPGLRVQLAPTTRAAHVSNADGAALQIVPVVDMHSSVAVIEGTTDPVQGWVSVQSGEKHPAPTLRYRRTVAAPTRFCTVIYPHAAHVPAPEITEVAITTVPSDQTPDDRAPDDQPANGQPPAMVALRIATDTQVDHLLLAPGSHGVEKRFGAFTSTAEVVLVREEQGSAPQQMEE